MANLNRLNVPPPFAGMDTVSAPGKCATGYGPIVKNFLVHTPGKLMMRGPLTKEPYKSVDLNSIITGPVIIAGAWSYNNKLLLGFANKSTTAVVPPWVSPYFYTTTESEFSQGNSVVLVVDIVAGTAKKIGEVFGSSRVPYKNGVVLEGHVYGIAYGSGGEGLKDENGVLRVLNGFLKWDGNETVTLYKNAPKCGQDIKSYLNRIWVLGGKAPGGEGKEIGEYFTGKTELTSPGGSSLSEVGMEIFGTGIQAGTKITKIETKLIGKLIYETITISKEYIGTEESVRLFTGEQTSIEPNTLFYSVEGGPVADETGKWKDEISGLVNRIVVGDNSITDFGVALAIVGQTMLIFKRHSIWALYGYSKSTFQVKNLSYERGCIDPFSVCEIDGGVYFMSQNGLEFFDGSQFTLVDSQIANITRPAAALHAGEKNEHKVASDYGRIQIKYIGNNYIMMTIVGQHPNTNVVTSSWAGYMHIPTGNWAEFSTAAFASQEVPLYIDNTNAIPWAWDGRQINPMPFLTNPETANELGFAQVDTTLALAVKGIPARFRSDRIPLASPGYTSQQHRFLFDYRFPNGATDGAAADGWFVTVYGDQTTEKLISEEQVPGQAELKTTAYLNGRRWEKDIFNEATSAAVEVQWKSTRTTQVKLAEIYDTTLELQVARQRRST